MVLCTTSLNAFSTPRVPVFQCCIDFSSFSPSLAAASPFPHFTQILNRKVLLGDTTGDTNVMGATQANTKGVGTLSWHHPGGSYFSPQGQLDPERDSLCPSGSQHTSTLATQHATALNTD